MYTDLISLFAVFVYGSTANSKADKRNCDEKPPYLPKTAVNTTARLQKLREQMKKQNISAYIIPSTDAHGSEYVREQDKRRGFISGFSGSAGTAIVTLNQSALWTDGRYFLQGDLQLDCNWILQKQGQKGVPSQTEWLKKVLKAGDVVGIDPFLIRISSWDKMVKDLKEGNITLQGVAPNLVDEIWTNRPVLKPTKVEVQLYNFTGKHWWDKIMDVQKEMKEAKVSAHVVQELDAVAWLLNLRGKEISYNPVFFAYVIVKENEVLFFVNSLKISTQKVQKHLQLATCKNKVYCIITKQYNEIKAELETLSKNGNKIWLGPIDSQALRLDVAEKDLYLEYSPIRLMKGKKNKVELEGMRSANLKDSVALSEFFLWTEKKIAAKAKNITELKLEEKMEEFRRHQALYKELSFSSIIGFAENGAVIHYKASKDTNKEVTDKNTLLVDSGSQYSDGSTDITRTVHFGTPTKQQKSAFTRVLIGQIELVTAVFPEGTYGREVDIFAREALYRNGWDYRHGTGHGIGSYLYIHEGPGRIAKVGTGFPHPFETPLHIGFVLSDEPGYYEDGSFGIRLETAVVVINASTPYRFNDIDYYTFEPISFFPVQRKLIDESLMTERQIKWVDDYHKKTEELVGAELKKQGKTEEREWLLRQTKPIKIVNSNSVTLTNSITLIIFSVIVFQIFL